MMMKGGVFSCPFVNKLSRNMLKIVSWFRCYNNKVTFLHAKRSDGIQEGVAGWCGGYIWDRVELARDQTGTGDSQVGG